MFEQINKKKLISPLIVLASFLLPFSNTVAQENNNQIVSSVEEDINFNFAMFENDDSFQAGLNTYGESKVQDFSNQVYRALTPLHQAVSDYYKSTSLEELEINYNKSIIEIELLKSEITALRMVYGFQSKNDQNDLIVFFEIVIHKLRQDMAKVVNEPAFLESLIVPEGLADLYNLTVRISGAVVSQ